MFSVFLINNYPRNNILQQNKKNLQNEKFEIKKIIEILKIKKIGIMR